jgi:hypothetical protein
MLAGFVHADSSQIKFSFSVAHVRLRRRAELQHQRLVAKCFSLQMWASSTNRKHSKPKPMSNRRPAPSNPTRPMRAVIAKKEVVAVSRSIFVHLSIGLGALLCSAPGVLCSAAAEPASARQCAEADLVLMHRLTDEAETSVASSSRLVQAAMKRLDARAACSTRDYDGGVALFAEAYALTLDDWRMWRVPGTDFSSNNVR